MKKQGKVGKKNIWERFLQYEIEDLDKFIIPQNKVLIEVDESEYDKTVGGIITVREHDFAAHAVRRGKVVKNPSILYSNLKDPESMPWDCDLDTKENDIVYIAHSDSYHSIPFNYKDKTFKLINYDGIVFALRGEEIIMCNGYILLEKIFDKIKFGEYEKKIEDKNFGIIRAVGKPNRKRKTYSKLLKREVFEQESQVELEVGKKVYIADPSRVFELEDYSHAVFDERKIYNVCNRRRLGAIMD